MSERHRKTLAILAVVIYILLLLAITWVVGRPLLRFVSEPELFRAWVDSHGLWGRLAFVGMMALQVVVAIIPGEPLEIGAGYAFGALEGTILCLLGAFVGSLMVFGFVRRFGVRAVEVFFSREKIESTRFLRDARRRDLLVFVVFLLPGTPKDILSYMAGLTTMRLRTWMLISSVARIPSVVTSTIGGDALGMGKIWFAVIVLLSTLLLSLGGLLIYQRLRQRREERHHESTEPILHSESDPRSESTSQSDPPADRRD